MFIVPSKIFPSHSAMWVSHNSSPSFVDIYNTPASQPMFQPMPQPPRIPLGLVFQGYSAPVDPEFLVLLRQVERENRTIPMDIIWRHAEIIRLQQENNVLRFLFEYFFAGR
jgi:hypothetical protein